MVAYGIGILLLIKFLKAEFNDISQPWYADDTSSLGTFANIELYFNSLKQFGPGRGYYPKPSKSVLIVNLYNLEYGKQFGLSCGFNMCTGMCYLGGFIGGDESKRDWLKLCMPTWEWKSFKIHETAGKSPQEIYAVVVRVIQLE